jgi:hypothetical protein
MLDKIQLHYQPVEDRLLLLVTVKDGEPLTLWLTRRVTQKLLQGLDALVGKDDVVVSQNTPERKAHVQQFQREQAAETSNFQQEKLNTTKLPTDEKPKLVADVRLDKKMLRLPMTDGQTLNLEVSTQLAYILTNLINAALPHTHWNIQAKKAQPSLDFTHQKYPTMTVN